MRGDLVTIALQGGFGKPRPALVIQADWFSSHTSVTVLPATSALMLGIHSAVLLAASPCTGPMISIVCPSSTSMLPVSAVGSVGFAGPFAPS